MRTGRISKTARRCGKPCASTASGAGWASRTGLLSLRDGAGVGDQLAPRAAVHL